MTENGMVSFVVIAYNEENNIASTLDAIVHLDDLGKYEIIVVNDGSADATARVVQNKTLENSNIKLIDLRENCGRGHARNVGVCAARGEFIATIDADIVVPNDWLTRTRRALDNLDAVAGIAVPDGDVQYLYRRFGLSPRVVGATNRVTGNNGLYRRAVFDIVEFDASLREGEDSALNHAMKRQGLSFATIPNLLVRHQENKNFATSLKWLFAVGKGATRQLVTYREVREPDIATAAFLIVTIAGVVVAVQASWIGVLLPIAFVVAVALQHVRSRFETPPRQWPTVGLAIAADAALLTAYFGGRVIGILATGFQRSSQRAVG